MGLSFQLIKNHLVVFSAMCGTFFFFEFSVTLRWFSGGFTNTVVVLAAKSLISTTFAVLFNSTAFSVHPIIFICQQPQQNRTGFLLCNRPTTLHNCKSCNSNPTLRERKKWKYFEIRLGLYQRWQKKLNLLSAGWRYCVWRKTDTYLI